MTQYEKSARQKTLTSLPSSCTYFGIFLIIVQRTTSMFLYCTGRCENLRLIQQYEFSQCTTITETPELSKFLLIHSETSLSLSNCTVS